MAKIFGLSNFRGSICTTDGFFYKFLCKKRQYILCSTPTKILQFWNVARDTKCKNKILVLFFYQYYYLCAQNLPSFLYISIIRAYIHLSRDTFELFSLDLSDIKSVSKKVLLKQHKGLLLNVVNNVQGNSTSHDMTQKDI